MTANTGQAQTVTVVSADGTPIAVHRTGQGPALVAVHGTAADHTAWDSIVPLLVPDFTIHAMDRRGRGASGDAPDYALEREFEDVAAVVAAVDGPAHLYGHSFGGLCAVEAALRTPNLASLTLYEGGPKPPGLRLIPDELITRLDRLIQAGDREEALTTFMLKAAGVTADELSVLRAQPAWGARIAAAHTITRELRAFGDYDGDRARFRDLAVSVLLILGGETEPRRRDMFERLAGLFPGSRVAVLPGQRHAAHQTAPQLLATTLREFLQTHTTLPIATGFSS
jgi:pimeloyl-ACP methyl ester carboxylesterase